MIQFEQTTSLVDTMLSLKVLHNLRNFYPDFDYWYVNKAMPGIITGQDILLCAKDHGTIVGVALGKKRENEFKLRCVRVEEAYQKRGVGMHLVDRMLTALDCDKPHCTVSEEMLHEYSRAFIEHYRFSLDAVDKGMYRRGKLEYVFNGKTPGLSSPNDEYLLPNTYREDPVEAALKEEVFSHLSMR